MSLLNQSDSEATSLFPQHQIDVTKFPQSAPESEAQKKFYKNQQSFQFVQWENASTRALHERIQRLNELYDEIASKDPRFRYVLDQCHLGEWTEEYEMVNKEQQVFRLMKSLADLKGFLKSDSWAYMVYAKPNEDDYRCLKYVGGLGEFLEKRFEGKGEEKGEKDQLCEKGERIEGEGEDCPPSG